MLSEAAIKIPVERVAEICRRYGARELALFGSALGEGFGPDSDVDLLVEFEPGARVGLVALSRMSRELSALLGRRVDLVPKRGLKEKVRRAVLERAEIIYAA